MPTPFAHAGVMAARLDLITTTLTIGAISLFASACSPSDAAERSTAPRVDDLRVVVGGAGATVVADVSDDDDDLASVVIEWGDGVEQTVESGFPGLRVDHAYTVVGAYTVIVQALDDAGNSAIETADVEIGDIDDVAAPSTTTTEPTATTTTDPTGAPPRPTPPPTTAPTPPPPPPPTTPPPTTPPDPEPVEVDLLDTGLVFAGTASPDDNAGGSADVRQPAFNMIELHAEALNGYNGRGTADGALIRVIETGGIFDDQRVTAIAVVIEYSAIVDGHLRGPFDRRSTFELYASIDGGDTTELIAVTKATDETGGSPDQTISDQFNDYRTQAVVAPGESVRFELRASCSATSGGMAFALNEHGWCDFLGGGRQVALTELRATFIPILD